MQFLILYIVPTLKKLIYKALIKCMADINDLVLNKLCHNIGYMT